MPAGAWTRAGSGRRARCLNRWVAAGSPDGADILFTGQGRHASEADYPLTDHAGWLACGYAEDGVEFTVLHDSQSPGLTTDTAAAAVAVRASLATG
ncbi:hypothetical protein [Streptomyces sp. NPDC006551]|uniref:hypothetical protein n=1 Tax=Streptomyces sp. NPDC006551 TaxID=3157178 RepID=UPI0033BA9FB0